MGRVHHERIRVAAAGDIHCSPTNRARVEQAFDRIDGEADVILLAGDLTTHGEPEQAHVLADVCRGLETPVVAVVGNHDWHANRLPELLDIWRDAGIVVLERESAVVCVGDVEIGIVGLKGFVGGFDAQIADFGEPLFRELYAETTRDVEALERGLQDVAGTALRIVLLHYAPIAATLEGEPPGLWPLLGSGRLAGPIAEFRPDLVLHGHAHAGTFEGAIGDVPVYNVAVHVMGRDFWIFELDPAARRSEQPLRVEEAT